MSVIYVNKDSGDWFALRDGRWILQGNLHAVARNSARPDSEVVISLAEKREQLRR